MTLLTLWILAVEFAVGGIETLSLVSYSITSGQVCNFLPVIPVNSVERFGQILTLLVSIPPFIQVCQIVPQLWLWITNLTWVVWRCRKRRPRENPAEIHGQAFEVEAFGDLENPTSRSESAKSHKGELEIKASSAGLQPNLDYAV